LSFSAGSAHACNPFKLKFTIARPPMTGNLALFYKIVSQCGTSTTSCPGQTPNVTAATTMQDKCNLLVNDIMHNPACNGAGANFTVGDVNCADPTHPSFTVTDPTCPVGSRGGVSFGLANFAQLLNPNTTGGSLFGDYELDIITPDCPAVGTAQVVILDGLATGVPINPGNPSASVVAVADLTQVGGGMVFGGANTAAGQTAEQVTANVVTNLNIGLVSTGVNCFVSSDHGRVIECKGKGGASIGVGIQADDTGFVRGMVSGVGNAAAQVVAQVDSPAAPVFNQVPIAPLPPPAVVPATGGWALAAIALLLAAAGAVRLSSRRRRPFSA
jgi:hypothetical protein